MAWNGLRGPSRSRSSRGSRENEIASQADAKQAPFSTTPVSRNRQHKVMELPEAHFIYIQIGQIVDDIDNMSEFPNMIDLAPDVENALRETYLNKQRTQEMSEAICGEHFTRLIQTLTLPPSYTTLRCNTLKYSREETMDKLLLILNQDYARKGWEPPQIELHPLISDLLIVTNRGPMIGLEKHEKWVIVDLLCGMSVLRGADVFAQGIMSCPNGLMKGDSVSVYADMSGKCLKGLTKPYTGEKVFLGNGVTHVSREELFCEGGHNLSGLGVEMVQPLYQAPSLADTLHGWVFPQNLPSVVCGHVLDPKPGEFILDMCASPGGKTTHIGCLMKNKGRLIAFDKSVNKIKKIDENCKRMDLTCVETYTWDASKALSLHSDASGGPPYPAGCFDRVLVDAPCSALGQRPSFRNKMTIKDLNSYPKYQRKILSAGLELVKPGGVLVYSTCSLPIQENEGQVEWVLQNFPQYTLETQTPVLGGPGFNGTSLSDQNLTKLQRFDPVIPLNSTQGARMSDIDTIGFFIAKFKRHVT